MSTEKVKTCPFCGCTPKADGDIITHKAIGKCIIDDTQYDIKIWNKRVSGWISVKYDLPENQAVCLVVVNRPDREKPWVQIERWYDDGEHGKRWGMHGMPYVTHWQLLPEPPK